MSMLIFLGLILLRPQGRENKEAHCILCHVLVICLFSLLPPTVIEMKDGYGLMIGSDTVGGA